MPGNDTFTKVLLHMDGSDGGTTFTDSNAGGSAHTWTAAGNANTDTGIVKFGTAALLCDGTGDFITTPDHADWALGSSDFTIDCWFNRASGDGTFRHLCGTADATAGADLAFLMRLSDGNKLQAQIFPSPGDGSGVVDLVGTTSVTSTGWHHAAFVRSGNTVYLFLDGTQEDSDTFSSAVFNPTSVLGVGCLGAYTSLHWNGSIDEFRLSVGVARWTANFTPPTAEYSGRAAGPPFYRPARFYTRRF